MVHLVLSCPAGLFPFALGSKACLESLSCGILLTWPNHLSWDLSIRRSNGSTFLTVSLALCCWLCFWLCSWLDVPDCYRFSWLCNYANLARCLHKLIILFFVVVFVVDFFSRLFYICVFFRSFSPHKAVSFRHGSVINKVNARRDDFPVPSHPPCRSTQICYLFIYFRIIYSKLSSAINYVMLWRRFCNVVWLASLLIPPRPCLCSLSVSLQAQH